MIVASGYLQELYSYCKTQEYKGDDPYDGLNSLLFRSGPLYNSKLARQIWTQVFKFNPINLRRIFLIKRDYNSKGLALFILGLLKIYQKSHNEKSLSEVKRLLYTLKGLSLKGYSGYCWGYNFPWQSRSFFAPNDTPNAICTVFVADAFLSAYEVMQIQDYLDIAKSSLNFFLKDLRRSYRENRICFSYTPLDNSQIHNVNIWIAYFITRLNLYLRDKELDELAHQAVSFLVNAQNSDGSWYYGTAAKQLWIDSFHTGYNLVALKRYIDLKNEIKFRQSLEMGYRFFDKQFFLNSGIPKYYHNKVNPIDIHSAAQGIITYFTLKDLDIRAEEKAKKILSWTIKNMWDKKGYFYFQKHRFYTIKIPYMRWAQAWMFYALSCYLYYEKDANT